MRMYHIITIYILHTYTSIILYVGVPFQCRLGVIFIVVVIVENVDTIIAIVLSLLSLFMFLFYYCRMRCLCPYFLFSDFFSFRSCMDIFNSNATL